jgi:hypothetical protein
MAPKLPCVAQGRVSGATSRGVANNPVPSPINLSVLFLLQCPGVRRNGLAMRVVLSAYQGAVRSDTGTMTAQSRMLLQNITVRHIGGEICR